MVATMAGGEAILFVEDDPAVRSLGQRVLTQQGYGVRAFANGAEALAAVREGSGPLDLLVTDVIMPGMNGRVLADELRRLNPALKVLFTSGYTQDVIAPHGVLEPGVEFLPKPYSFAELTQKVRAVLG
jgi:two-component system cell cycle sensor histidine kinase/response regulator CckA